MQGSLRCCVVDTVTESLGLKWNLRIQILLILMALLPEYLCHGGQVTGNKDNGEPEVEGFLQASSAYIHEFT